LMVGGTTIGGSLTPFRVDTIPGDSAAITLSVRGLADALIGATVPGDNSNGFALLKWDNTNGAWRCQHASSPSRQPMLWTTNLSTAVTCGRSTEIGPGQLVLPQGVWIG